MTFTRDEANAAFDTILNHYADSGHELHGPDFEFWLSFESGNLVFRGSVPAEDDDAVVAFLRSVKDDCDVSVIKVVGQPNEPASIFARFPFETGQPDSLFEDEGSDDFYDDSGRQDEA